VAHAQSKGAVGVIISNNVDGNFNGTLGDASPLVVVSISKADGNELQSLAESGITGTVLVDAALYSYYSGTSMACPHVAGVAALIFAADDYNITTPQVISNILFDSAQDLGQAGPDDTFGYGLVDADAALQMERFNLLAVFASYWLQTCSPPTWCDEIDSDHSTKVDFTDFAALAQVW
jgi:subtilisin family serine protease